MSELISVNGGPPPLPGSTPATEPSVSRWRWWVHLLLIGSYPMVIVALGARRGPARGPALSQTTSGLLQVCAVELALFLFIFFVGWLFSRASRDELLCRWRPGIWVLPLGVGYSFAIRLAVGLLVTAVGTVIVVSGIATPESLKQFFTDNRPQVESLVDVSVLRNNPAYYWLSLTLVSFVVAGLREELWRTATLAAMRKLWPRAFDSRFGQLLAIALIAVVFGAAHANLGIIGATMAGFLGLLLGAIMVWHRSIWPAVIAHGLFDATSIALLPWALEKVQQFAH